MEKIISEQRRKDLEAATKLYLDAYRGQNFDVTGEYIEYAGFYYLTNELFEKALQKLDLCEITKALSVLASGDQVIHLVQRGIYDIDTFDINRLTEYYALGFKKRAIECLSFEDYNKLFEYYRDYETSTHCCQHLDIEKYVIENMEEEYKWFWQELFHNLKELGFDAGIFHFAMGVDLIAKNTAVPNTFMEEKEKYKELQQKLTKANLTFKHSAITDVPTNFPNQYDLICLSNIMDHYYNWVGNFQDSYKARNLLKKIYDNNLKPNGIILQSDLIGTFFPELKEDCRFKIKKLKLTYNPTDAYIIKKEK